MALKNVRIGAHHNVFQYDDTEFTTAINTHGVPIRIGASTDPDHAVRRDEMPGGFGGVSGAFAIITAIQVGGAGAIGFQYKNRTLTFTDGVLTTLGAESGWNDV